MWSSVRRRRRLVAQPGIEFVLAGAGQGRTPFLAPSTTGTVIQRGEHDGTLTGVTTVKIGSQVSRSWPRSTPTSTTASRRTILSTLTCDVDEADIGQVKVGQPVRFSVDTYPERDFRGTVAQIRLSPKTANNVVTYPVKPQAPSLKPRPSGPKPQASSLKPQAFGGGQRLPC